MAIQVARAFGASSLDAAIADLGGDSVSVALLHSAPTVDDGVIDLTGCELSAGTNSGYSRQTFDTEDLDAAGGFPVSALSLSEIVFDANDGGGDWTPITYVALVHASNVICVIGLDEPMTIAVGRQARIGVGGLQLRANTV